MSKKEKQPKKLYWGTVAQNGFLEVFDTRKGAEAGAEEDLYYDDYSHVVKLVPEVVKTVRRKA